MLTLLSVPLCLFVAFVASAEQTDAQIPKIMKAGRNVSVSLADPKKRYRTFVVPVEVNQLMHAIAQIVMELEGVREGQPVFDAHITREQLNAHTQRNKLFAQKTLAQNFRDLQGILIHSGELADKLDWIIKDIGREHVEDIGQNLGKKLDGDGLTTPQNRDFVLDRARFLMKTASNEQMRQLDTVLEQSPLRRFIYGTRFHKNGDFAIKLNAYLDAIRKHPTEGRELGTTIASFVGALSMAEQKRIVLCRLIGLERNLIRKLLDRENVRAMNEMLAGMYADGKKRRLEAVKVFDYVEQFDFLGTLWSANEKAMRESRVLREQKDLWPVDQLTGEVVPPIVALGRAERQMRHSSNTVLLEYSNRVPIPPERHSFTEMEVETAFAAIDLFADFHSAHPMNVPDFVETCGTFQNQFGLGLCAKLKDGVVEEALLDEIEAYENRRENSKEHPCAMLKIVTKLFFLASSELQEKLVSYIGILANLKYAEYAQFCRQNVLDTKLEAAKQFGADEAALAFQMVAEYAQKHATMNIAKFTQFCASEGSEERTRLCDKLRRGVVIDAQIDAVAGLELVQPQFLPFKLHYLDQCTMRKMLVQMLLGAPNAQQRALVGRGVLGQLDFGGKSSRVCVKRLTDEDVVAALRIALSYAEQNEAEPNVDGFLQLCATTAKYELFDKLRNGPVTDALLQYHLETNSAPNGGLEKQCQMQKALFKLYENASAELRAKMVADSTLARLKYSEYTMRCRRQNQLQRLFSETMAGL